MVKGLIYTLLLTLAPALSHAAEAVTWEVIPEQSSIKWEATQNNAPITGGFTEFKADISFHPETLDASKASVSVETKSIFTGYDEARSVLKTKDWFFVDQFPQAAFEVSSFEALPEKDHFKADATLTIRDKTIPVVLNFTLNSFTDHEAHITGETTIKRTEFGIGWSETAQVADDVKVLIDIKAKR